MGNIFVYSGLSAKIRAMGSRLLTDQDYEEISYAKTVAEGISILRRHPDYERVMKLAGDHELHRNDFENLLTLVLFRDFIKIYRFCGLKQRKFLDVYFITFELTILKTSIRSIYGHKNLFRHLDLFEKTFHEHSKLDLSGIMRAQSILELKDCLKGTPYKEVLERAEMEGETTLLSYENQLDIYYFIMLWKAIDKLLKKEEKKYLQECFGKKIDMLNIQWMYRSGKYYGLVPAKVYAMLIPVQYKLKREQVKALSQMESTKDFLEYLKKTLYGKMAEGEGQKEAFMEISYRKILNEAYKKAQNKEPWSILPVLSFFYFRHLEIGKLVTAIEGVRYGVPPAQLYSYITQGGGEGN